MMRLAVLLAVLPLVSANCGALDTAKATDELLDASNYIFASVQRCNEDTSKEDPKVQEQNKLLCFRDVTAGVESSNALFNSILNAANKCGDLGSNAKCGLAVGGLTKSFEGVAKAGAGIKAKCADKVAGKMSERPAFPTPEPKGPTVAPEAMKDPTIQCLVDMKDVAGSLFKSTMRVASLSKSCDTGNQQACANNYLKVAAALSGIGQYLSGVLGKCKPIQAVIPALDSECFSEVMDLIRELTDLGSAGLTLSKDCGPSAKRLYELDNGVDMQSTTGSSATLALAALLPISAVLSFMVGSRFAKQRRAPVLESHALELE